MSDDLIRNCGVLALHSHTADQAYDETCSVYDRRDVVARVKAALERLDGRDGPFCVDCGDRWVGVDTELVEELVAEVERLGAQLSHLDRLAAAVRICQGFDDVGEQPDRNAVGELLDSARDVLFPDGAPHR